MISVFTVIHNHDTVCLSVHNRKVIPYHFLAQINSNLLITEKTYYSCCHETTWMNTQCNNIKMCLKDCSEICCIFTEHHLLLVQNLQTFIVPITTFFAINCKAIILYHSHILLSSYIHLSFRFTKCMQKISYVCTYESIFVSLMFFLHGVLF